MPREIHNRVKDQSWDRQFVTILYPPPHKCYNDSKIKYELENLPNQRDPVLKAIHRAIAELSKHDMYVAGARLTINRLSRGSPIWPLRLPNAQVPINLYAFKEPSKEFPFPVPVSIQDRGSSAPLTGERILVKRDGKKWQPLNKWFVEFARNLDHLQSQNGQYAAQRQWWKQNGKTFAYEALPWELRNRVLLHILGSRIRPCVCYMQVRRRDASIVSGDAVVLGSRHSNRPGNLHRWDSLELRKATQYSVPNYAIFAVSRQVNREAWYAGWISSWKFFACQHSLSEVVSLDTVSPRVLRGLEWLAKIRLELTIEGYLLFLGIRFENRVSDCGLRIAYLPPPERGKQDCTAKRLVDRKSVTHLELHFLDPYDSSVNFGAKCCMKTTVDWIALFAFPFTKQIKHVSFTGAVKSYTREKWNRIHAIEYRERNLEYRTHGFDWDEEVASLMNNQPLYTSRCCECPASCIEKPWDLEEFDCDDTYVPKSKNERYPRDWGYQENELNW